MGQDTRPRRGETRDEAYRDESRIASRAQGSARKARMIAALRAQAAALSSSGVMFGSLPQIHEHMSEADIAQAARRMNVSFDGDGNGVPGDQSKPKSTASAPAAGTNGKTPLDNIPVLNQTPPKGEKLGSEGRKQALADIISRRKSGKITAEDAKKETNALYQREKAATAPKVAPKGSPERKAVADASARAGQPPMNPQEQLASPMLDAMTRSGTLGQGSKLIKTGAGYSTPALNPDGTQMTNPDGSPRWVAVNPTGAEAMTSGMNAQTGNQWGGWSPEQRASYLRSLNPKPSAGNVIDDGMVMVGNTPMQKVVGGLMYDPRLDPAGAAAARANSAAATAANALRGPEAPGMYDENGKPTTNTALAVRLVGAPVPPATPPAATAAAPANPPSLPSRTAMINRSQAGPTSGVAPTLPTGNTGTNLPGPAGSTGTAYQNAPRPVAPQPATSPVAANAAQPAAATPITPPAQAPMPTSMPYMPPAPPAPAEVLKDLPIPPVRREPMKVHPNAAQLSAQRQDTVNSIVATKAALANPNIPVEQRSAMRQASVDKIVASRKARERVPEFAGF